MKNLKKLGELKLMPEKMLNQDELVNFRGGSGAGPCAASPTNCPTKLCSCSGGGVNICGSGSETAQCYCNGVTKKVTCAIPA